MTLRLLFSVTHLVGAGHLTRMAAIARAAAARGHAVTLATGGEPSPLVPLDGVSVVQLPPLRARPDDFSTLLRPDGEPAGPDDLAARRDRLAALVGTTRPDAVVTELFPFGRRALAGEFEALLAAAEARPDRPVIACSVRDILVAPARPAKIERTHALLRSRYDVVLVHGDPSLVPLDASWPVPPDLPLRYTGYVDADPRPAAAAGPRDRTILVAGGSSAAALPLYRAAIGAARRLPERPVRLLVGHGVAAADFALLAAAAPANARVERARPDFRDLLRRADLLVGLAGYNTVTDVLATGIRALFVPFERGHETEQRQRADRLAASGRARLLPEALLDDASLAAAMAATLADPAPASSAVATDGAARTVAILEEFAAARAGRAGAAA